MKKIRLTKVTTIIFIMAIRLEPLCILKQQTTLNVFITSIKYISVLFKVTNFSYIHKYWLFIGLSVCTNLLLWAVTVMWQVASWWLYFQANICITTSLLLGLKSMTTVTPDACRYTVQAWFNKLIQWVC